MNQRLLDYLTNQKITNYGTNEDPFYKCADICNLLKISNTIKCANRIHPDLKSKINISDRNGRKHNYNIVNTKGVLSILIGSNKADKMKILNELKIEHEYAIVTKEANCISNLIKVYKDIPHITQYVVLCYRIDLYFPDHKLAIEYDEKFHNSQVEDDLIRQTLIEVELGCIFIRIPEVYDIFNVIYEINKVLYG